MEAAADKGCDDLLVVGTRGTLEPFAVASVLRDGERLAVEQLPPFAEELLMECPAFFEPVALRETGIQGANDGTTEEAYA